MNSIKIWTKNFISLLIFFKLILRGYFNFFNEIQFKIKLRYKYIGDSKERAK